ncbi:MAG: hypothetical protein R3236_06325, partial [Phycisphaeraceae bacterium]|nr:hypothetical protein [Phycisphaeraceae bacterium]
MMFRKISFCLSALALAVAPSFGAETDSWRCLPKQTVGAFRIHNTQQIYEALKNKTQLGATLFRDDRIDAIKKLMKESDPAAWDQANAQLAEYNLSVDHLMKLATAKFGLGVLMEKHAQPDRTDPLMLAVMWVETEPDLMSRLMAAFEKGWQENQGGADQPIRKDIDLGGTRVIHLINNQKRSSFQVEFDDGNKGGGAVPPRGQAQVEIAEQQNDQSHFLMTQSKGKLLMAMTLPNNSAYAAKLRQADKPIDWSSVSGETKLKQVFGRFLKAHDGDGEADGFAAKVKATPGLEKAMPTGTVWMEGYLQVAPFVQMAEKARPGLVDQLGIGRMGMMGTRTVMRDRTFDTGGFIALPAPHQGLMKAMTSGRSVAAAPSWLTSDVAYYGHLELDLGKVYTSVGQLDVGGNVQLLGASVVVEGLAATLAKTDFASVLSALGSRHGLVIYGAKTQQEMAMAQNRLALVWNVEKAKVWEDIFANVKKQRDNQEKAQQQNNGQAAPGQNLPVRVVEKAKYKVMVFENPQGGPAPSLYLGQGHLIMAVSDIAAERVLDAIASPPKGDKALVNSPLYKAAVKQLPVEEGMALSYTNIESMSGDPIRLALDMLRQEWANAANEDPAVRNIKDVRPTKQERQGAIGASAAQTNLNKHGKVERSLRQMP